MSNQENHQPGATGPDAFEKALATPTPAETAIHQLSQRREVAGTKARRQKLELIDSLEELKLAIDERIKQLKAGIVMGAPSDRIRRMTDTVQRLQESMRDALIQRESYDRAIATVKGTVPPAPMEPDRASNQASIADRLLDWATDPADMRVKAFIEASTLGLKPGSWPLALRVETSEGVKIFERGMGQRGTGPRETELLGFLYTDQIGDREIFVAND